MQSTGRQFRLLHKLLPPRGEFADPFAQRAVRPKTVRWFRLQSQFRVFHHEPDTPIRRDIRVSEGKQPEM